MNLPFDKNKDRRIFSLYKRNAEFDIGREPWGKEEKKGASQEITAA